MSDPVVRLAGALVTVCAACAVVSKPLAAAASARARFTTAGRQMLMRSASVRLTGKGTFTPPLYEPISATRAFTMTR